MTSQLRSEQFQAVAAPSVLTSRNFGLLRGKPLADAVELLRIEGKQREYQERSSPDMHPAQRSPTSPPTAARGVSYGVGGVGDKVTTTWDWPMGPPTVTNTDTRFEVTLKIWPYLPKEVQAYIMGNDLIVHCEATKRRPELNETRHLTRTYTLPLNVDPKSARFSFTDSGRSLRLVIEKEPPLKLAVAYSDRRPRQKQ